MNEHAAALSRAILFAATAHADQEDRAGRPYILHPLWVMRKVAHLGDDYAVLGVCHDAVEDQFSNYHERGFVSFREAVTNDPDILLDLRLLTHDKKAKSYTEYIKGIKSSRRATEVKKRDLEHNSAIIRLKGITAKDLARIQKYHASYLYLNDQHDKLFDSLGEESS